MTSDLFFDTDCLSAFLWINDTNIIEVLYGGHIILPEPVYQELSNPYVPQLKKRTDTLICRGTASVKEIETGTEEYDMYVDFIRGKKGRKHIGRGEAAGIALAKVYNGILASNNYKDIKPYIDEYGIKHIDTGHILIEALKRQIITEEQGNVIWQRMLDKKRCLPSNSFSEYLLSVNCSE